MVDTSVLRHASHELGDISNDLEIRSYKALRQANEDVETELKGAAADAISEKTQEIKHECRELSKQISEVAVLLKKYASLLDEADAAASNLINSR